MGHEKIRVRTAELVTTTSNCFWLFSSHSSVAASSYFMTALVVTNIPRKSAVLVVYWSQHRCIRRVVVDGSAEQVRHPGGRQ